MYAIIMAGGGGTRFWPLSRERSPKQFLDLVTNRPLIEEAYLRIAPIFKEENVFIIVNSMHTKITKRIFRGRKIRILTEPYRRNTAACIGLAAIHIHRESGNVPVVVLPADHFIAQDEIFRNTLLRGVGATENEGISTIGTIPTYPETGYGYIKVGKLGKSIGGHKIYNVDRFVEKPDSKSANLYIKSGNFLWNTGIFIFKVRTILEEMRHYMAELYKGLESIERVIGSRSYSRVLREVYANLESISIDHGIMEKTKGPIYVLPGDFDWSDVGSWKSLYDLIKKDRSPQGNLMVGESLPLDTKNSLVYSRTRRLITTLGIKDLLIVDTRDALLVADIKKSQEIRKIVEYLKKERKIRWL